MNMKKNSLSIALIISIVSISLWVVSFLVWGFLLRFGSKYNIGFNTTWPLVFLYFVPIVLSIVSLSFPKKGEIDSVSDKEALILSRIFSIISLVGSILCLIGLVVIFLFVVFLVNAARSNDGDQSISGMASILFMLQTLLI